MPTDADKLLEQFDPEYNLCPKCGHCWYDGGLTKLATIREVLNDTIHWEQVPGTGGRQWFASYRDHKCFVAQRSESQDWNKVLKYEAICKIMEGGDDGK